MDFAVLSSFITQKVLSVYCDHYRLLVTLNTGLWFTLTMVADRERIPQIIVVTCHIA